MMWFMRKEGEERRKLINRETAEQALADCDEGWEALFSLDREPTELEYIDEEAGVILPQMERVRASKWGEVKTKRNEVQDGGCATPLGVMQTDALSRNNLVGAVTGAQIALGAGEPMTISWRMANNEIVDHSAADLIAAGMAVLAHVQACYDVANELEAAITAAETVEDIDAIDVAGAAWPTLD